MQHTVNTPYAYDLSHLPRSAEFFVVKQIIAVPNRMSSRESRTDSILRFCPTCGIQQKATAGITAITNKTSRGNSNNGSTAVASVCVCVCVFVCACLCVCVRACAEERYWV